VHSDFDGFCAASVRARLTMPPFELGKAGQQPTSRYAPHPL
jgi:hypothetical protein